MEGRLRSKVVIISIAIVLCALGSLWKHFPSSDVTEVEVPKKAQSMAADAKMQVYVSGAVARPGLYELKAGTRAKDAVEAAGGMTSSANATKVNLAKRLKDGTQVNVPELSAKQLREQMQVGGGNSVKASVTGESSTNVAIQAQGKVHLNSASLEELRTLPGVGQVTAQKIVDYRASHSFVRLEDLMQVKGIGAAKFAKMRPYLEL